MFELTTSKYNVSSWQNNQPSNSLQIYWIFTPAPSIPGASRVILKFRTNKKNSSGSLFPNKTILNSQISDFYDVIYLRNFIFTEYLSHFTSFLLLMKGIGGGSTWSFYCTTTTDFLVWNIIHCRLLFLLRLSRKLLCKVTYALSN